MSDAIHRMTVLASAFARIASQFTELATELSSTVQPVGQQASPESIEQAVSDRMNDTKFLRRLSPFVMEQIDFDDLAEEVAGKIDTDDVARLISENIDTDEIVRSVADGIDCADIAESVVSNVSAEDIAGEVDMDDLAERIDCTMLAGALLERDGVLAHLASEMVAHRYEAKLREWNLREEYLTHEIAQLRQTTTEYHQRIREYEANASLLKAQLAEAHLAPGARLNGEGESLIKARQAEADDALSRLVDACIDAEASRCSSHIDPADMTGRQ